MPRGSGLIDDLPPPARTLRVGQQSEHVEAIQERLNELWPEVPIVVSGGFGPATRAKLRHWQAMRGRTADGECDAATWAALRAG